MVRFITAPSIPGIRSSEDILSMSSAHVQDTESCSPLWPATHSGSLETCGIEEISLLASLSFRLTKTSVVQYSGLYDMDRLR